jgi:hypothetical protein
LNAQHKVPPPRVGLMNLVKIKIKKELNVSKPTNYRILKSQPLQPHKILIILKSMKKNLIKRCKKFLLRFDLLVGFY